MISISQYRSLQIKSEHDLQVECVRWFDYTYPEISKLLYAVPNGGYRTKSEAGRFRAEGVRSGVADLVLQIPNREYSALCIEMKYGRNTQQQSQKQWQALVTEKGKARYTVCYGLEEFKNIVTEYLKNR